MRLAVLCALLAAASCGVRRNGPDTTRVYDNLDATHRVDVLPDGHGSAVVIDAVNGYLLTCHHVAGEGRKELVVNIAAGGSEPVAYPAKVVAWDKKKDLAVIKVERRFETSVVLGDLSEVHPLDDVYEIGFPYDLGELGSKGAVKSIDYDNDEIGVEDAMLVEIDGVPGTSGSGIFLARNGKLVGLMRGLIPRGPNDGRQIVVRLVIRIDDIRAFLDRARIPYRTAFPQGPGGLLQAAAGASPTETLIITIPPPAR